MLPREPTLGILAGKMSELIHNEYGKLPLAIAEAKNCEISKHSQPTGSEGPAKIRNNERTRPDKEMRHEDEVSTQNKNAKLGVRSVEVIEEVHKEPVYWYEAWDKDW